MFAKVLVTTDDSENAKRAIAFAVDLVRYHPQTKIVLVNAYNIPPFEAARDVSSSTFAVQDAIKEHSQSILDQAADLFKKEQLPVETASIEGDPGQAICEYARKQNCDHIIIGVRGQTRMAELLFGSVTRKVIQLAPCPVTIVR